MPTRTPIVRNIDERIIAVREETRRLQLARAALIGTPPKLKRRARRRRLFPELDTGLRNGKG